MTLRQFDPLAAPLTGRNLVEASAGTGKTFAISRVVLRLLIERGLSIERILVVTFTEAAANELKVRIHGTIKDALAGLNGHPVEEEKLARYLAGRDDLAAARQRLENALRSFDEAAILTIHTFCSRVLRENAFECGGLFDTDLVTEQTALLREVVHDFWRRNFYHADPGFLRYALSKLGPDDLLGLLDNRLARGDIHIVPEVPGRDCRVEEAEFEQSFLQLQRHWADHRDEVLNLLLNHPGMNQGSYKPEQIQKMAMNMDAYCSAETANLDLCEKFEYLTETTIEGKTNKGNPVPKHEFFKIAETHLQNQQKLEACFEERLIGIKAALFDYARSELTRRKQALNVYYFDDLLLNVHAALRDNREDLATQVRLKYRAALIDEFQDTDPVQYDIFRRIFDHPDSSLFLIGDPKQAIYSFRGADIFAYMQAKSDTGEKARFTLGTNYRSGPTLVQAVNALFSNVDIPFLYENIPFQQAKAAEIAERKPFIVEGDSPEPFRLWMWESKAEGSKTKPSKVEATAAIVAAVADEIVRLLQLAAESKARIGEKCLQEKEIAVLVSKHAEAHEMQEALLRRGVNSVLYSSGNLFASDEATEMERILAAIIEPNRGSLLRAALATEILAVPANVLLNQNDDDAALESWFLRFSDYNRIWQEMGFIRMFAEFRGREHLLQKLMRYENGERRITNLLHLAELLNDAAITKKLSMSGLLKWLSEQRRSKDPSIEEHQIRLESDDNAVRLLTMHISKGLQFPVVFCPFSWQDAGLRNKQKGITFHDEQAGGRFTLALGSAEITASEHQAEKENLAEKVRLLYVALTRAEHRCYLVWGQFSKANASALSYLLHKPTPFDKNRPLDALKKHCSHFKAGDFRAAAEKMARKAGGSILLETLPEAGQRQLRKKDDVGAELQQRSFSTEVDRTARITSYSSLISRQPHAAELADHDTVEPSVTAEAPPAGEPSAPNLFRLFPRGAKTGVFAHDLLQHLDFTRVRAPESDALVRQKLGSYGFEEKWTGAVREMLEATLTLALPDTGNLSLAAVRPAQRLNELEFYFPLRPITPASFRNVFRGAHGHALPEKFPEKIEELSFSPLKGYMKGFIDLVFEHEGRTYLVDWKSNYLGPTDEDYGEAALASTMVESYYVLQYHIYTLALHQYLKNRLPGYDYDKHFGGVFYIFLRGPGVGGANAHGIYAARPERQLILDLAKEMLPGQMD